MLESILTMIEELDILDQITMEELIEDLSCKNCAQKCKNKSECNKHLGLGYQGKILYASEGIANYFGYGAFELKGKSSSDLLRIDPQTLEQIRNAYRGKHTSLLIPCLHRKGYMIWSLFKFYKVTQCEHTLVLIQPFKRLPHQVKDPIQVLATLS